MTAQTRATNKGRLEDGDVATGSTFSDLIDSFAALVDTTAQVIASDLRAANFITAGKVSAATLNIGTVSADTGMFPTLGATTFQASSVSGAAVRAADLFCTVSGNFAGALTISASGGLALISGDGASSVTLTTASNPVNLTVISSAGGRVMAAGMLAVRIAGAIAYVPFWR